ncbi:MAG TPA: energy transducer TonB [Rhizomicrobium sp.]|jgi:hypothetical protein
MSHKVLRSMFCLLAMNVLITGATAQPGNYVGCVKYAEENSKPSLISVRQGEQEITLLQVNINTEGNLAKCTVVKGSGSERLDGASCDWVKDHWRLLGRCQDPKSYRPQL